MVPLILIDPKIRPPPWRLCSEKIPKIGYAISHSDYDEP
jgi:hypothetical protein